MSSKSAEPKNNQKRRSLAYKLIISGGLLLLSGLVIFILTFYPILKEEFTYQLTKTRQVVVVDSDSDAEQYGPEYKVLKPVNTSFSIVVPRIAASAPIVGDVDPYDPNIYQRKLTQGVAHAMGTSLPGKPGNAFFFAHSAGNFYEANRYNAVFYLLNKLEKNDEIYIYHNDMKYIYTVSQTTLVNPEDVEFLTTRKTADTITLMTCWPPGTTLKRLIIQGDRKK